MTTLEKTLPAIDLPIYRALCGTTPDEIRLVHRGGAWWLLILDGNIHHVVRLPYDDVEEFALLLADDELTLNSNLYYIRQRLNQIMEEKIA